jgi:hypothetical protein
MKSLKQLCIPRASAFDTQRRDTVLDISDLIGDRIKPDEFFTENYLTEGMKTLLEQGFRRLEGRSNQGVFKLKQAMGGGKTHNLLTLGLLAKHPEYRQQVMGRFYTPNPDLGPVKVVVFSGRESDAPFGIWGAIAEQLGKKEHFKDLYSPGCPSKFCRVGLQAELEYNGARLVPALGRRPRCDWMTWTLAGGS